MLVAMPFGAVYPYTNILSSLAQHSSAVGSCPALGSSDKSFFRPVGEEVFKSRFNVVIRQDENGSASSLKELASPVAQLLSPQLSSDVGVDEVHDA